SSVRVWLSGASRRSLPSRREPGAHRCHPCGNAPQCRPEPETNGSLAARGRVRPEGGLVMAKQTVQRVEKPWGHELIWARTAGYVGKILHIKAGHRLSLQYHRVKEETILLARGKMTLVFENEKGQLEEVLLKEGEAHHITVGRQHRMIALEECDVFEVSTPQVDDVVRVADGYGRAGT